MNTTPQFDFHILKPRGSAQCRKCGRFARIVRTVTDMTNGATAMVVDCRTHGEVMVAHDPQR